MTTATRKHAPRLRQLRTLREDMNNPDMLPAGATASPLHRLKTTKLAPVDPADAPARLAKLNEILADDKLDDTAKWNMIAAFVNESAQGVAKKAVASPTAAARNVGAPLAETVGLLESRRATMKSTRKVPRLAAGLNTHRN